MVKQAEKALISAEAEKERTKRLKEVENSPEPSKYGRMKVKSPVKAYQKEYKRLSQRYGKKMDVSRADYMICCNMLVQGFKPAELEQAMNEASPELPIRKAGHEADYTKRTIEAAQKHPEVKKSQSQRQSQEVKQDRGLSL